MASWTKGNDERKALRRRLRERGYQGGSNLRVADLREAVNDPQRFGLRPLVKYPEFVPFDFSGITPKPKAFVKWKSPEAYRRAAVKGEGRFEGIAPDGRFQISYRIAFPGGYATKTVLIDPKFIVDYQEEK